MDHAGSLAAAAFSSEWDDVHEGCLDALDVDGADAVFARVSSALSLEEDRIFRTVVRDAAGLVLGDDDGVPVATQTFGMAFVVRDGRALTRTEILVLSRCLEEISDADGAILVHPETFAPADVDVLSPERLRSASIGLHEAWLRGVSADPDATPRPTWGLGASSPVRESMEVGFLLGVREVPPELPPFDEADQSEEEEAAVEKRLRDLIGDRLPRLIAVDFPSTIGQSLPNAMLRSAVTGLCHDVFVATSMIGDGAEVAVTDGDGVAVSISAPDGRAPVLLRRNVENTGLDASDVADIVRHSLPDMLLAYSERLVGENLLPN